MKKEALFLSAYLTTGVALVGAGFYFAGNSPFSSDMALTEEAVTAEPDAAAEDAAYSSGVPAAVWPEADALPVPDISSETEAVSESGETLEENTADFEMPEPVDEEPDTSELFFGKSATETDLETGYQVSYEVLGDGQITLLYENQKAADEGQTFLGAFALADEDDAFLGWVDGEAPEYLTDEETYIPERTTGDRTVFAVFSEKTEAPAEDEEKEAQAVLLVEDHLAAETAVLLTKDGIALTDKVADQTTNRIEDKAPAETTAAEPEDLSEEALLLSETSLLTMTMLSAPQQIEHPVAAGISSAGSSALWMLLLLCWLAVGLFYLLRRRAV